MTRTKDTFTINYKIAEMDGNDVVLKEATYTASDKAKSKETALKEFDKKVKGGIATKVTVTHRLYEMDDNIFYSKATLKETTTETI